MIMTTTEKPTTTNDTAGGRLVAADGRELPLQEVHLSAEAGGGIARVRLTQRFVNPFAQPLEVRYLLPLPSDGAVSGFSFTLGDVRVVGEVTGKQAARERFHQAMAQGKTAALLEQERTSVFTQRVGNVPPHAELTAEVVVDQPLKWLDEGAWEWRFPTVVGPRYLGEPGRVADAAALSVAVADGPLGVRASLALTIDEGLTGPVESPSHAIESRGLGPTRVRLEGDGAARLDRDVVVRWPVALPDVSANVLAARPATAAHDGDAFALVTVAPPTGGWVAVPRDLTFLIDTSGSMGGRPLEQAACVIAAMIDTLGTNDRIELIEFGSRPRRWHDEPVLATETNKAAAVAWVRALSASGSTEMHRAVLEALRPLRPDSQRQVVLVTDGYIGFEQEVVRTLLNDLPAGARLHTVGVGSSVNRSLTQAAARAGRGTELLVGPGEDAERLAARLVARTAAPLVTDLVLEGAGVRELAPRRLPDLYVEAPALLALRHAAAGGEVVLRGRTADGPFEKRLRVPALEPGAGHAGVAALFAREKVEDLEMALTAGGDRAELDRAIEDTGVEFQLSTRLTSWIAVSKHVTVTPGATRAQVEQPHELPHGVSAEGLGLRQAANASTTVSLAMQAPSGRALARGSSLDALLRLGPPQDSRQQRAADTKDVSKLEKAAPPPSPAQPRKSRYAELADELVLEDSTSDTVININDITARTATPPSSAAAAEPSPAKPDEADDGSFGRTLAGAPIRAEGKRKETAGVGAGGEAPIVDGIARKVRPMASPRGRSRRRWLLVLAIIVLMALAGLWLAGAFSGVG